MRRFFELAEERPDHGLELEAADRLVMATYADTLPIGCLSACRCRHPARSSRVPTGGSASRTSGVRRVLSTKVPPCDAAGEVHGLARDFVHEQRSRGASLRSRRRSVCALTRRKERMFAPRRAELVSEETATADMHVGKRREQGGEALEPEPNHRPPSRPHKLARTARRSGAGREISWPAYFTPEDRPSRTICHDLLNSWHERVIELPRADPATSSSSTFRKPAAPA